MDNILTQERLLEELEKFKFTLENFDYSDIKNIIFINLDSLYCYIENIEDNPFKLQYKKLQNILDIIEPYIPFTTENEYVNITDMNENFTELEDIKRAFSAKKRFNFINYIRSITTESEWQDVISICKDIRNTYERYTSYV